MVGAEPRVGEGRESCPHSGNRKEKVWGERAPTPGPTHSLAPVWGHQEAAVIFGASVFYALETALDLTVVLVLWELFTAQCGGWGGPANKFIEE